MDDVSIPTTCLGAIVNAVIPQLEIDSKNECMILKYFRGNIIRNMVVVTTTMMMDIPINEFKGRRT